MKALCTLLAAVTLPFAVDSPAVAGVEVAEVFGPEMVLQCDLPVPIWGIAEPGQEVTVSFAGQSKTAAADPGGRWSVLLDAMPASAEPRTLTVTGGGNPTTLQNVRLGEVWLLLVVPRVGMQYSLEGPVPQGTIRVRDLGGGRDRHSPVPQARYGQNRAWGPDRHQRLDVVSIPFANRLGRELGVPLGIVRTAVGELDATIPPQGFAAVPALDDIARRVDTWYPATGRGKAAYSKWLREIRQWKRTLDRRIERGQPLEPSQPPLVPGPAPGDPTQPTVAFNRQLFPLAPFALRGVLHVHAEADQGDPACSQDPRYTEKMRALIAGLRAVFRRGDLAFAFGQRGAPNIYHQHTIGGQLSFNAWAGHRDRQRRVLPQKNAGMVVTLDVENHLGKVGQRFARWALAEVYGKGGTSSGPIYKGHRVQGDRVVLEFDHTEGGLMVAETAEVGRPPAQKKDGRLRFFAVAAADGVFRRAQTRIEDDTVVVRSDKVSQPVAVRYACQFDPRGMNLYNRAGLPASPFRTDDWPIGSLDETVQQLSGRSLEELVAMLGYPAELSSHAAAKALAGKGEAAVMPILERLIRSHDPDRRCGGLRALGYLYWMGPVPRNYYSVPPQEATPAVSRAIGLIEGLSTDGDCWVRRCAAEALGLIGAENETVFGIIQRLAVDGDAGVRTAAVRLSKYRFKRHAHNTALAYAVLTQRPLGDRISAGLAGNLLNHYRLTGPIDMDLVGRYLLQIGPDRGGPVVGSLGDMLRRMKTTDGKPGLNDPRVLPGVLHLYALGYRNYMLYGVERWIAEKQNVPAFRQKVAELRTEIRRLEHRKPEGWADLVHRYEDAIDGLGELIGRSENVKQ